MKNIIFLIAVLILGYSCSTTQHLSDYNIVLDESEHKNSTYKNEKLTIVFNEKYGAFDRRQWIAFKGNDVLEEHDLYKICGKSEIFEIAKGKKTRQLNKYRNIFCASGVIAASSVYSSVHFLEKSYEVPMYSLERSKYELRCNQFFALSLISLAASVFSGSYWMLSFTDKGNCTTYIEAKKMVDDYNLQLAEKTKN